MPELTPFRWIKTSASLLMVASGQMASLILALLNWPMERWFFSGVSILIFTQAMKQTRYILYKKLV